MRRGNNLTTPPKKKEKKKKGSSRKIKITRSITTDSNIIRQKPQFSLYE